jgi:hypothetical protein
METTIKERMEYPIWKRYIHLGLLNYISSSILLVSTLCRKYSPNEF